MADAIVTLCLSCAPESAKADIDRLRRDLQVAGLSAEVRGQACLNCCAQPRAMALQGQGRATLVFHAIDPAADREDMLRTVRAYLAAEDGEITDARGCGRLRFCLRARVGPI